MSVVIVSVTVRLVVAAKVVLSLVEEADAESEPPFDSVSETRGRSEVPEIASDASVIGLLDGVAMVKVIVEVAAVLGPTENSRPGLLVAVTGSVGKSKAEKDGDVLLNVTLLIVASSTVQVALAPPER